jgi:hypothetical protein
VTSSSSALPATLSASLNARIAQLSEPARGVFDAIVVLGKHCTVPRLAIVTELPRYSLTQALRFLDEHGFTRINEATIFASHDLLATAAQRRMSPSVARLLHASAAKTLEAENVLASDPVAIAMHWDACGEQSRGKVVLIRSADAYTRLGRPHEAIRLLMNAKHADGDPDLDLALFEACHAAGEDHQGVAAARRIGLLDGKGLMEKQVVAMEMLLGACLPVVPYLNQLRVAASDRSVSAEIRARAARLLVVISDDLADQGPAKEALSAIADLNQSSLEALIPRLIHEAVFGSPTTAAELASEVFSLAAQLSAPGSRLQAMRTATLASLRTGATEQGKLFGESAYNYARDKRIWSAATAFASMIAELCWMTGDNGAARFWHDRSTASISQSGGPDRGFQHLSMAAKLAIEDQNFSGALELLDSAERMFPRIKTDRMRVGTLALRVRIEAGLGRQPCDRDLDELLKGHMQRQNLGGHDYVADVILGALRRAGRGREATELRAEYLTKRRESYRIPTVLTELAD